jgi:MoaA/NifB/PqqE/SkfB family radical SAM enzyme
MKTLDIKLHYKCNNNCLLCCLDKNKKNNEDVLSPDAILSFIASYCEQGEAVKIILTGGEPTLYQDIVKLASEIKSMGCQTILLQTNGTFLNSTVRLEELIGAGVNLFGISLHGHISGIHEGFTQTKGSFDNTILTLYKLKEYNVNVFVNTVISTLNIDSLTGIIHLIEDNELAQVLQFAYLHIVGRAIDKNKMAVPIRVAAKKVIEGFSERRSDKLILRTEAIPCCLLRGRENIASELFVENSDIVVFDNSGIFEFSNARKNILKTKGPKCGECLFNTICEGPWKEYPQLFGWDEFVPIKEFVYK